MNKYTSLELSKKIAEVGCELGSGMIWLRKIKTESKVIQFSDEFKLIKGNSTLYSIICCVRAYDIKKDICERYAKEFFGKEKVFVHSDCGDDGHLPHYEACTMTIKMLMEDGENPEDFIWKHCLFNPKNKEKK